MERNRRLSYHPHSSDPEALDRFSTELTRTTNSASSAISLDTYRDISRQCAAPFPVTLLILMDELTRWTDRQHNLYLNSLEASFVNEMSTHLHGCQSLQNNLNEVDKSRTSQKSCTMSGQFMDLQDGFCKKVIHERNEPMLGSTGDSHVLAGIPTRFTSVERGCAMKDFAVHHDGLLCDEGYRRGKSIFSGRSSTSSAKQHDPCYPESVATAAEFTDQNFKDEAQGARSR
ncbi:cold-regulated protein 27-like isoform X2 [Prosopis cineraria]|uniref:cold-regulated protein 27-like isoform X2 n=1 Tax=Prosopis cineraria TaxID=364024 RepID=UPI002410927E|nr:cold-regulated protein 27-like isoform X2 [Prosopis cineraria]